MAREFFPSLTQVTGRPARDAPETADTFLGNAQIKARALASEIQNSNFWVLSDDSGIEVDALGGQPGVHSARYAGDHVSTEAHIQKLLNALKELGVPAAERQAHYVCALVLLKVQDGVSEEHFGVGRCSGLITEAPVGGSGFGYDPIFYSPELGCGMSEVSYEEKNRISHRRRAFQALRRNIYGS